MKKIYTILSAIIIALAFAACSSDFEDGTLSGDKNRVKVNIKVAGLNDGEGTRAIKKSWERGDKLNIWFDGAYWNVLPQLVLTYDGTKWNASDVNPDILNASGKFNVIYEASNSLFAEEKGDKTLYFPSIYSDYLKEELYASPLSCFKNSVAYSFTDNTITAEIDRWQFMTQIQVVVTGLPKSADKYALTIDGVDNAPAYYFDDVEQRVHPSGYGIDLYTLGMPNKDGVAFTFGGNPTEGPRDIMFTLMDMDTNEEYTYTKSDADIPTMGSGVFAIKIDGSKFTEVFKNINFTVNGASFSMVAVEGGTFTMGATLEQGNDIYKGEKPEHQVTLSNYHIGKTEVTQALWTAVMGSNPSEFKGEDKPVERVNWVDCQRFITKLNALTGKTFRLPTEAEWEYACRGGNKSKGYMYSGSNNIDEVAWYNENSRMTTHDVASKLPNELGIYDMSGNVWEWCQDWFGDYSETPETNPTGPEDGIERVFRSGGWGYSAWYCRSSFRRDLYPGSAYADLGFRLALSN